MAGNRR